MEYHPQVFIGKVQPTGHCGNSGIDKHQVGGLLQLLPLGLAGDEQAEKNFMGDPIERFANIRPNIIIIGANATLS